MSELDNIRIYPDGRMDARSASAYTGLSYKSLAIARSHGDGPPFVKLRKTVFYLKADLDAWISSNRVMSTAQTRQVRKAK